MGCVDSNGVELVRLTSGSVTVVSTTESFTDILMVNADRPMCGLA